MLNSIFKKFDSGAELTFSDLVFLLSLKDKNEINSLFNKAYVQKVKVSGHQAFIRGLIEFSNICPRNCYYCGIRKSNNSYKRYSLSINETMNLIRYAFKNDYSSIVIQAGERQDHKFIDTITEILLETKKLSNNKMRVTLSLGEQTEETYKKWFDAGAHRYLLRIETTNPKLYKKNTSINL